MSSQEPKDEAIGKPKEQEASRPHHKTPMLDTLEDGPWPSFVSGLKRLARDNDMMADLLGQLEHSYETKKGYWKGVPRAWWATGAA